jgi:hypothetical protein
VGRWSARSGFGARGLASPLRSLVRELASPAAVPVEAAW